MITHFVEATNGPKNWGKFMLARFSAAQWAKLSHIDPLQSLIRSQGWTPEHLLVLDLATGEAAIFKPGGNAKADLNKHAIWVCPLFEPFLAWLWRQDVTDITKLPQHVDLPDAPFEMQGYRRDGNG